MGVFADFLGTLRSTFKVGLSTLSSASLTAARTHTLPDLTGVLGLRAAEIVTTSEALAAGDFVNFHNSAGNKARKANATAAGTEADGFVLAAFGSGASALVYLQGTNTAVSGQTVGPVFLQTTAGLAGATVPGAAGNVVQPIGKAISATAIVFNRGEPITRA